MHSTLWTSILCHSSALFFCLVLLSVVFPSYFFYLSVCVWHRFVAGCAGLSNKVYLSLIQQSLVLLKPGQTTTPGPDYLSVTCYGLSCCTDLPLSAFRPVSEWPFYRFWRWDSFRFFLCIPWSPCPASPDSQASHHHLLFCVNELL